MCAIKTVSEIHFASVLKKMHCFTLRGSHRTVVGDWLENMNSIPSLAQSFSLSVYVLWDLTHRPDWHTDPRVLQFFNTQFENFCINRESVILIHSCACNLLSLFFLSIAPGCDFSLVQKEVAELLEGHILVGHSVHNDLRSLFLSHPRSHIRDTSKYAFNCLFCTNSFKQLMLVHQSILLSTVFHIRDTSKYVLNLWYQNAPG